MSRLSRRNKRKRLVGNVLAIALLLFLIGAIIVVLNFNKLQGQAANSLANDKIELQRRNHQTKKPNYNLKKVKPISPQTLAHAWRCRRDYRAIGQIAVPSENILLNIFRGTGNDELALGVGTLRSDQRMGQNNYPLAGHNMDDGQTYFSPLYTAKVRGQLAKGTRIFLTDFKKVYFYRIDIAYFIGVYNLRLAFNRKKFAQKPVISLFTCDWTGQGRLFVRGHLTGSQSLKSASRYVRSTFKI
ncbi:Sortase [Lactobacillus kimbladii]|uniref:Sortase n=1 Tax=Lactobacillus kimbladii TaxID=1218506 RepID=A0A0F4LKM2_9LACO|nr:class A sortase [Lactobacillus kimbladii]KJY59130.1 Sortase [Lactobacillus kimbladii]